MTRVLFQISSLMSENPIYCEVDRINEFLNIFLYGMAIVFIIGSGYECFLFIHFQTFCIASVTFRYESLQTSRRMKDWGN